MEGDFVHFVDPTARAAKSSGGFDVIPLTTKRKRHRRDQRVRTAEASKYTLQVSGHALDSAGKQVNFGPVRLRELIKHAVTGLFGEEASKYRFQWELVEFDETTKLATVSLVTSDYLGFVGALALLPSQEGRLRVLSKS